MAFSIVKRYREYRINAINEFYLHINDLLEQESVQQLDDFIQHFCHSRLKHSMDVAYYSFFIAKVFGWDARSTARAGLLHDLFLYDRYNEDCDHKNHTKNHPIIALENARKITELNDIEANIIRRHMWLATLVPPRYKEGYIVTFVDKYCAAKELFQGMLSGHKEPVKAIG